MVIDFRTLLGSYGVARVADLTRSVDRHTIGIWVKRRRLLRPYPGVVVLPERMDNWPTRALAAVYATRGTLSHTSALTLWRVLPESDPVHVSVPATRRALRRPGLTVHRMHTIPADQLGPFPVTDLPRSLVDHWDTSFRAGSTPRLIQSARGAVIDTLRNRQTTVALLREEIARRPALPGRAELLELLGLIEGGCQSELEIWGVRKVLRGPGMPHFVQQHPVRLPFGTVHLDAAIPELKIAVELDGAAFHGSASARERDTRRDAALAAAGWVVLRFSYRRLSTEPDACRRDILRVCATRRAVLAGR